MDWVYGCGLWRGGWGMRPIALSDSVAVGEVPTAEQIEILANAGFRSLLTTQPDGEVVRLMSAHDAGVLAAKAGLAFQYLPIESRRPDDASIAAFGDALRRMPRPIYACCYSGARAAAVWAMAAASYDTPDRISAACAVAGFDMQSLRPQLELRALPLLSPSRAPAVAPSAVVEPMADTLAVEAVGAAPPALVVPAPAASLALVPTPPTDAAPITLMPRAASAGGFAVPG
jgi:uncharacterized protein (TIGR01244 family)